MGRAVRALGVLLLVAGCTGWAWVAALEGPVDLAASTGHAGGYGMVELELYVLDLRLAPLLLAVAGVGLVVAPSARRCRHGVLAMAVGSAAALLVPVAVLP